MRQDDTLLQAILDDPHDRWPFTGIGLAEDA
jgi:hypothetical protein